MEHGTQQGSQFEQLQSYIEDARKAQELFQASKLALEIEYDQQQQQASDKRDAAVELATANFESNQGEIDELYNSGTQPHINFRHSVFCSAKVACDRELEEARAACLIPENAGLDAAPCGPEWDRFEIRREAILAAFEVANRTAEESFQQAYKPIKALWQLASKQNKMVAKAAEKKAQEVFSRKLRKIWKSNEAKKCALLQDFRAKREERLSIWQQYLSEQAAAKSTQ